MKNCLELLSKLNVVSWTEWTRRERTLRITEGSSRLIERTTVGCRLTVKRSGCRAYRTSLHSRCSGSVQPTHGAPSTDPRHSNCASSRVNIHPASSGSVVPSPTDPSLLETLNALLAQKWTQVKNVKSGRKHGWTFKKISIPFIGSCVKPVKYNK